MARALAPFLMARAPEPAAAELCEFHSVDDYRSSYARLALLLDRAEQIPAPGEIEFLCRLQNRGLHYPGAIGGPDYLFLMAFASILAPVRALEIGSSSGFSSAVIAAALQRRHPGLTGTLVDTIDLHTRYLVDSTKPIGFEIPELLPDLPLAIHVHTGRGSDFVAELARPAELAFAFIDADHQHPWPLLDSIRVAPYLQSDSWIVLHDIALGTMGTDKTRKGWPLSHGAAFGAEWLFQAWPFPKISGGNIGAVRLPANRRELLPMALQLLALPFEMDAGSHRRMEQALYRAIADLIESSTARSDL